MRIALGLVLCLLVTACGAGNGNANSVTPASLDGDRKGASGVISHDPNVILPDAPTDEHQALANLLPRESLRVDSVVYAGWNAEKADIIRDNPKTATLKAVEAKYVSTGFVTKDDPSDESKTTEHTFPQSANLYLIASPDPAMTSVIRQRIESKIERSGFTRKDPLKFSNAASREEAPVIERFLLVAQDESDPEIDLVYVAYVWNNDDLAIWAIEKEARRHIPGLDDISEQSGNRVGATLIALIEHQINQSK